MKNREITATGYTLNLFFGVAIFSAIPIFIFYKLSNELFKWEKFNPNGITTIVFLTFSIIAFLAWLKFFDNQPTLKINDKGIWLRKSILPFSSLRFVAWNQIKFVELNTIKQNKTGRTTVLVIHRNDNSKTKTIDLDNLDYSTEEIISLVKEFSKFLNYRDRMEVRQ